MTGLLIAALAIGSSGADTQPRLPVLLTTDCGVEVDDQWAIAHLALSPEFDLKGIVTTHAPGLSAESAARMARELLEDMPVALKPPVFAGSSTPLADKAHPLRNAGVTFLIDQARGHSTDDRLTVLVIGAATDVASALLADHSFADRIRIVAMGFDAWPEGGDVWNVKNDVRAWQVLLESRAPIVVGDSAVSRRDLLMTPVKAHALLDGRGGPSRTLVTLLERWLARQGELARKETGSRGAWPIWDEVTVAYLLGLTRSVRHPRPTLGDDLTFDHPPSTATIEWVTSVDSERLWADLAAKLDLRRSKK